MSSNASIATLLAEPPPSTVVSSPSKILLQSRAPAASCFFTTMAWSQGHPDA
ncbi:hypothetical protein WMF26_21770 [Sorangium sp. So ce185]|uniref:hypothetical protein n=1 Tax=Sorangium sp. So ce185 TaxID=3133287 RepID=UPI003F601614